MWYIINIKVYVFGIVGIFKKNMIECCIIFIYKKKKY